MSVRVEIRVVRLDLDPDRILESDPLERLVPLENAGADRLAILERESLRSSQNTIGCFGSDSAADGSFFSSRQRFT